VTWSTAETLLEASVVGVRLLHFDGSDAVAVSSARPRMLACRDTQIQIQKFSLSIKKRYGKKKNQKKPQSSSQIS
jgi:hypothetical protein